MLRIQLRTKRILLLCIISFCFGCIILKIYQSVRIINEVDTEKDYITIGVVGDLLFHKRNQIQAFSRGSYKSIWEGVTHHFGKFDILLANYEGLSAKVERHSNETCSEVVGDAAERKEYGGVYRSWEFSESGRVNVFNYHPILGRDLKESGFSLVSIANNHILDLCDIGLQQTMDILTEIGLPFIGAGRNLNNKGWYHITKHGNYKIAWVACTMTTNQIHETTSLLYCNYPIFPALISLLSRTYTVIAVVHGGKEYSYTPSKSLQNTVFSAVRSGAVLVLGNHAHTAQPIEVFRVHNRRAAVIWSIGNFISHQGFGVFDDLPYNYNNPDVRKRSSGILEFRLKPFRSELNDDSSTADLLEFGCFDYVPTCVVCQDKGGGVVEYYVEEVGDSGKCEVEGRWLRNVWGEWGECRGLEERHELVSKWSEDFGKIKPQKMKRRGEGMCLKDDNVFNYDTRQFE